MEDIRLGRKSKTFQTIITIPTASSIVIAPANPNRISLWLAQPPANNYRISVDQDAVGSRGIRINSTDPPLNFNLFLHGDLVTRKITAIANTADQIVSIIETVLEEQ